MIRRFKWRPDRYHAYAVLGLAGGILVLRMGPLGYLITFAWVIPIVWCGQLGRSRRRNGWLWGVLLGWLGVLILALMRPASPAERLADLEAEKHLAELDRQ